MKKLLSILVLTLLFGSLAFSQDFGKQGVLEFGGTAGFMSLTPVVNGETGDATSTIMFEPTVGYFIIDGLEVGLNPLSISSTSPPEGDALTTIGIWAFGGYHFNTMSKIHPYIEGLIGYTSMSAGGESHGGFAFGAGAGVKFELAGGLLLNAGLDYRFYTYDFDQTDKRDGVNALSVAVGLSGFLLP
jgi:opacity protein-like surface antigen